MSSTILGDLSHCGKGHDRLKKAFAVSCHGLVASSNSAQKAVIEAWIPVRIGLRLFKPVVRRDFHEAPHLHGNVAGTPHIPPQFAMLILFKMMARPACKPCSSMSWVLYLRTWLSSTSMASVRATSTAKSRTHALGVAIWVGRFRDCGDQPSDFEKL